MALGAIGILLFIVAASNFLPPAVDWLETYRPAASALAHGQNPYQAAPRFTNPIWTALPFIPLVFTTEAIGRAAVFVMAVVAFAYTAYHLGAKPLGMILFLLSPPVIHSLLNANVEWLVLLGIVFPPRWGLFFLMIKPQIGFGVALFWLVEAWRTGGLWRAIRVFAPATVAFLVSFVLSGGAQLRGVGMINDYWNASLWPWSIPIGIVLLVVSLRRRRVEPALAASPMLSPYVLFHAWSGAVASLAGRTLWLAIAVMALWGLVIFNAVVSSR
jgi:hypothetical protein